MSKDIQKQENYLPVPVNLDPILDGVKKKFRLDEEFRVFLDRNEDVRGSRPDVGFLLFLIEQQREAILNLEQRVAMLEKGEYVYRYIPVPKTPVQLQKEANT